LNCSFLAALWLFLYGDVPLPLTTGRRKRMRRLRGGRQHNPVPARAATARPIPEAGVTAGIAAGPAPSRVARAIHLG